jgi:dinuclear metal center YbgI/SA1388 family protein
VNLRNLCRHLEQIAPLHLAAEWDNNGLLAGDPAAEVQRILLAIDLTDAVLAEAFASRADLVLCYHPPIFQPLRSVVADDATTSRPSVGGRIHAAIRGGVALYAMHTTLDAAIGGTNDVLAGVLGLVDARPIAPHSTIGGSSGDEHREKPAKGSAGAARYKLVTFVPADQAGRVADAIFAVGGGRIGEYDQCSFRVAGTGTFFGREGAAPTVGQAGRFEQVEEVRLEIVIPANRSAECITALHRAHPYQTAAFDLYPLADLDERVGLGRMGAVAQPVDLPAMVDRIKRGLNVEAVWLAEPPSPPALVTTAACCAGSCGNLFRRAAFGGAQLYLTGELRHHDALEAARAGLAVVAVRHSVSERIVLARLAERLAKVAPLLATRVSQADADPFRWA